MEREKVIEIVLSASTYEECRSAEQVLHAWMKAHPEDLAMLDAGESLAMTLEGLEPAEKPMAAAHHTLNRAEPKAIFLVTLPFRPQLGSISRAKTINTGIASALSSHKALRQRQTRCRAAARAAETPKRSPPSARRSPLGMQSSIVLKT